MIPSGNLEEQRDSVSRRGSSLISHAMIPFENLAEEEPIRTTGWWTVNRRCPIISGGWKKMIGSNGGVLHGGKMIRLDFEVACSMAREALPEGWVTDIHLEKGVCLASSRPTVPGKTSVRLAR
jgi:hypothetical protein